MTFSLGTKSVGHLLGVHPALVSAVRRAILLTTQDFTVDQGLRTAAQEAEYVKRGVSHTLQSKHLVQSDGWGHAVDLVPWVDGKPVWDWERIYPIAAAMRQAGIDMAAPMRWGGTWGRVSDLPPDAEGIKSAHLAYVHANPRGLQDGPHFELIAH